jgi:hypothetical protein
MALPVQHNGRVVAVIELSDVAMALSGQALDALLERTRLQLSDAMRGEGVHPVMGPAAGWTP